MSKSKTKAIIWICLFIFTMIFAELGIPYIFALLLLAVISSRSESFNEYKTSFTGVAVFAMILIVALPVTVSNKELDTISLSVSNIEKHSNNIYIKTKEILDKGEITWEELDYLNKEKDEVSQWCAVFDRQADIVGLPDVIIAQGNHASNVFRNQDKDTYNMVQYVKSLDNARLTDEKRQWLEDVRSRSYEILMSKPIQEGYESNYNFKKWNVRYLYANLYNIIHGDK